MKPARGGNRGGGGGNRGGGGDGNRGRRHYGATGRSPRPVNRYVVRHSPGVAHRDDALPGSGSSEIGRRNPIVSSVDGVTKEFNDMLSPDLSYGPYPVTHGVGNMSPNDGSSKLVGNVSEAEIQTPEPLVPSGVDPTHSESNARTVETFQSRDQDDENQSASCLSSMPLADATHEKKEPSRTVDSGFVDCQIPQESQCGKSSYEGTSGKIEFEKSDFRDNDFSFDICVERNRSIPKLKLSLLEKKREMKRHTKGDSIETLRPGMFLLKGYISLKDQVKLIKACRDLGRGHGGFYQPGYRDGAKLHLKMMCLGKNWDPETSMYGERRLIDDSKPPPIPDEFQQMVKGALQECHSYLESQSKITNVRVLPSMSPDICIVNFYTYSGKLGLHQDKDESPESLHKELPVVSFSLGDSAEFLFGKQKDIGEAEKVLLQSGDVLIFGGESRLIFHGVSTIKSETAPKALLEETDLRPGRLNLTFRKY